MQNNHIVLKAFANGAYTINKKLDSNPDLYTISIKKGETTYSIQVPKQAVSSDEKNVISFNSIKGQNKIVPNKESMYKAQLEMYILQQDEENETRRVLTDYLQSTCKPYPIVRMSRSYSSLSPSDVLIQGPSYGLINDNGEQKILLVDDLFNTELDWIYIHSNINLFKVMLRMNDLCKENGYAFLSTSEFFKNVAVDSYVNNGFINKTGTWFKKKFIYLDLTGLLEKYDKELNSGEIHPALSAIKNMQYEIIKSIEKIINVE